MIARARLIAATLLLGVVASACGGGASAENDTCGNKQIRVPSILGGLAVRSSKKAVEELVKGAGGETYAEQASVFELRQGKELRGIFEIVRLTPDARPNDPEFRRRIVTGIGSARQRPENINGMLVYKGKRNQQLFYIWFQQCFLEVLIVREDASTPGAAVGVDLARVLTEALALRPVEG